MFSKRIEEGQRGLILYEGSHPAGIAQYEPIEMSFSPIDGHGFFVLGCMWVFPHFQKKGYGRLLMEKILEDSQDCNGLVTQAFDEGPWFPKSFYEKFGFSARTKLDLTYLMVREIQGKIDAKFILESPLPPYPPDKLTIDLFPNHACPVWHCLELKIEYYALEFGNRIMLRKHDCTTREGIVKYGRQGNILFNGKPMSFHPQEEEGIRETIKNELEKL